MASRWIDLTEQCSARPYWLPKKPAVYVVKLLGHRPIYIGSTKNLSGRVKQHRFEFGGVFLYTPWGDFKDCRLFARFCDDFRRREARLIRRLQPYQNKIPRVLPVPV